MMKKYIYISLFAITLSFTACTQEELDDFLNDTGSELTDSEINEGLKTALITGTDSSSTRLSAADGYFKDALVKILLPSEISNAITALRSKNFNVANVINVSGEQLYTSGFSSLGIASLKDKEDELILGINRAAEFAAKSAGPVFKDAIVQMSFNDVKTILNGPDTAATGYLRGATYNTLFNEYEPVISNALNSVKIGGVSVAKAYENYIADYNSIVNKKVDPSGIFSDATLGSLGNLNVVQVTDLSAYSTDKGLNGLFLKVSDEEKNIRKNPFAYISDILQKVFGSLLK